MPGAVGDVGDKVHVFAFAAAEKAVDGINQNLDDVYILPLVEAADVVGLPHLAFVEDKVYGAGVVFDIEPVAYVFAFSIDRERFTVADIVDKERYKFLGELIWAVVVGAVGHYCGHSVGVVEGADEVVATGLGGGIRGVGLVFHVFGEEFFAVGEVMLAAGGFCCERGFDAFGVRHLQGPIDFISADMVEAAGHGGRGTPDNLLSWR